MQLVVSGAHEGLKQAVATVFGANRQRCRAHFLRNAFAHVQRRQHQRVAGVIRTAFVQEDQAQADVHWREIADKFRGRFPKLSALMAEQTDEWQVTRR